MRGAERWTENAVRRAVLPLYFANRFSLRSVKTSPSKKRRAVAHAPQKKAGASGPPLSTQTSSNSQNNLLQHQISTETKDEAEEDSGKSEGAGGHVLWHVPACSGLLSRRDSPFPPLQPSSQIALISSRRPQRPATLSAQRPKWPLAPPRENPDPLPRVSLSRTLRMMSSQWA